MQYVLYKRHTQPKVKLSYKKISQSVRYPIKSRYSIACFGHPLYCVQIIFNQTQKFIFLLSFYSIHQF